MATTQSKRDLTLKKIAAMLEDQMSESGLSEEEKNEKTAELVAFVNEKAAGLFCMGENT